MNEKSRESGLPPDSSIERDYDFDSDNPEDWDYDECPCSG